jgi:hypothetical protein
MQAVSRCGMADRLHTALRALRALQRHMVRTRRRDQTAPGAHPAPHLARSSSAQCPYDAGRKRRAGRHVRCPALAGPGGLRSKRAATPSARGATASGLLEASVPSRAMLLHARRAAHQGAHTGLVLHQGPQNTSPRLCVHSANPTRFLGHVFPSRAPPVLASTLPYVAFHPPNRCRATGQTSLHKRGTTPSRGYPAWRAQVGLESIFSL